MSEVLERCWPAAVGAWLGIGTAPATLVLGAAMAARHGGAVPVAGLLVGAALMAALLWGQGRIGLRRPLGDGQTLTAVLPAYLGDTSRLLLAAVLTVSMVGLERVQCRARRGLPGRVDASVGLGPLLKICATSGMVLPLPHVRQQLR
ncbi:hypothetical protein ACLQ28_10440 [Micromonospora sp. DT201]|uniref:hypothetical protein n=1 Tax=Micromonospora sp. DT201 TaxID=3393442 RepID=UPI003CF68FDB